MKTFLALLIPALLAIILIRMLLMPIRWTLKIGLHSGCGFLCLWLLNTTAPFTGITFPMNAVTVLTAGTLGLPGIGLLTALELL